MKRVSIVSLIISLIIISLIGCSNDTNQAEQEDKASGKLSIFATVYPIQFLIEEIGGDTVDVKSIFPPGVDAHTYEPTSREMTQIATSDAFFFIGSSMEGFVESAANALEAEKVKLIAMEQYEHLFIHNEHVEEVHADHEEHHEEAHADHEEHHEETDRHEHEHNDEDGHDHDHLYNPHIWIDPLRMIEMANIVHEELVALRPENADYYDQNKEKLIEQLEQLDQTFLELAEKKQHKYIIVPHAAYDYWTERYGIEQIAISGISTTEEPSQKHLTEIIQMAEKYQIEYVLYEQNTPNKIMNIIKEQTGAETETIHNLSVLTDDDIENNADYISLMEQNIETLDKVLK